MSNPQYWFKRRRYGYGWTPASWQGWTAVATTLLVTVGGALLVGRDKTDAFTPSVAVYLGAVTICILVLVSISMVKGPKPKWRWGKSDQDNPSEDI